MRPDNKEPVLIICMPKDQLDVIPGSMDMPCGKCREDIVVAPSSMQIMANFEAAYLLCPSCARIELVAASERGDDMPFAGILPIQLAELIANNVRVTMDDASHANDTGGIFLMRIEEPDEQT